MTGVVVTGGTGGIGRAVVERYDGVDVVCSYHKDNEGAQALVDATDSEAGRTVAVELDVTDPDSIERFAEEAEAALDSVDVVVHTVGIVEPALLEESTDDQFGRVLETNLTGTARVARAFLPALRESAGSLVVLSSVGGTAGTVDTSYAASKAGLHGFVRALAREVGPDGVRVNALAPGPVDTSMNDAIVEHLEATGFLGHENVDTHLPEYSCSPEEVARSVAYLVDSEFTHGEVHSVNGGMHFR
ncbi:SDR family NAD(P)-dependent oxidoreductase [Halobaculum gomorrense]|uniref:3-oxoacyl-[acyl-carrier protein] reductase n=1 Tax=Halobaculum gomorrense TaxID=43928 RepID=A0A1M5PHJ9_9EURY|nr:SDR family oxidoreductase [Halobaculum gomorrense]SHH01225.1 3-oxoacyl-[acyl-carrier protein] reductase [Halobaculum gomorrense]